MLNTRYFIQAGKVNKKGKTPVMLDLNWRGLRLKMGTGVLVTPDNFVNTKKQYVATGEPNSLALNWKLKQLVLDLERDYLLLDQAAGRAQEITVATLRAAVTALLDKGRPLPGKASAPGVTNKSKGTNISQGTDIWAALDEWKYLNRHKHSAAHLRHFDPAKKWLSIYCPHLTLEMLTEDWVQEYVNWLLENTTLRSGGMRSHIKFFRAMLRFKRLPYEWLQNPFDEYTSAIDLTYEEMQSVYKHTYLFDELRTTADAYTFMCQVGLRFGDYLKLEKVTPVQTKQGEVLVILDHRQGKTKQVVTIPLNETATAIWQKYDGQLPKCTNQEYNRRLKQVGRAAGLTRLVDVTTVRGGVYTTVQRPVWEILSAHTSRHTSASLLLEATGSKELSQITLGQSSRTSTNIYARHKQMQQIEDSLDAWDALANKH